MVINTPKMPLVSVIIPTFNEGGRIADCLHSVVTQDYPMGAVEILVVDGGSQDQTEKVVSEFQDQYENLHLLTNPGRIVSTAMNIGIHHSQGDYIIRVDAHCVLGPNYLRQCIHCLRATGADNVGGLQRPIGDSYVAQAIALTMSSPLAVGDAKFRYSEELQEADTVYMGAFPRSVFDRVGLYNDTLVRNQDYELNYRIRAKGGRVYLSPALRSYYLSRQTLPAFWNQYFDYGLWKVQMLKQHPGSVRWRQLAPPTLVTGLVAGGVLGFFYRPVAVVLRFIVTAYAALAGLFALKTAKHHGWRLLPILPLAFVTMHISWGLGFLCGLVWKPQLPTEVQE